MAHILYLSAGNCRPQSLTYATPHSRYLVKINGARARGKLCLNISGASVEAAIIVEQARALFLSQIKLHLIDKLNFATRICKKIC